MKLKPIFASLMLLGLVAPAFADTPATANASTQSQLDSMKAQLTKMEAIVNQNSAGGFQQVADWTSRITVSGMANVDGYMSNTTPNFSTTNTKTGRSTGGHSNSIAVNNANLFVDALVNDWTDVHLGLAYSSSNNEAFSYQPALPTFDEGYVTIANFNESPFFFRAGREYLPFGVYNRFPLVVNPTQLLSETSGTAAQIGFVSPFGMYGSIYGFRGLDSTKDATNRPRTSNYGANLGYAYSSAMYGLRFDAGYLRNMADVNYIANGITNNTSPTANQYSSKVGGLALSADGNVGPFDASLRYVKALRKFAVADAAVVNNNGVPQGAEPSAFGAELGYTFPVLAHQSRIDIGYQRSYNSPSVNSYTDQTTSTQEIAAKVGGFGLPKHRYYAGYTVNVSKWTDVGVEVYHDRDFSTSDGGTGTSATVGVLQLGIKFA